MSEKINIQDILDDGKTVEADDGWITWGDDLVSNIGTLALLLGVFDLSNVPPGSIPDWFWEEFEGRIDPNLLPKRPD